MDVTGIRDNFDATQFNRKLTLLGVDVAYQSHRAVIPGTGCHTNAWRVYFAEATIPDKLHIAGDPVNQIKFQNFYYRVYFKGTKGTPFHGVNGVSTHCLDMQVKRPREDSCEQVPTNNKSVPVVGATTRPNPPARCRATIPTQQDELPNFKVDLSLNVASSPRPFTSSLLDSIGGIAPVAPTVKPSEYISVFEDDSAGDMHDYVPDMDPIMSMEVDVPFQEVSGRKKRKERSRTTPKTLADFATPNFFAVLRTYNGGFQPLQWRADQDTVTMIPSVEPRMIDEDERSQCITTMHQSDNSLTFDVKTMSIGRLHDTLTASIAQVHAEDLVDTERTLAEALEDDLIGLIGALPKRAGG
ncbi:hypothetical protein DYB32_010164 [Aphanomyces invadans]|uniref:Uncharacterized protein n=1 Tax=Aphanomyces invadans TaxID=157072 RepID=A0A418AGS6_9STRA|nr:hypothetical protein DYB32_010164 [Aphanomyces invadans]